MKKGLIYIPEDQDS